MMEIKRREALIISTLDALATKMALEFLDTFSPTLENTLYTTFRTT